MDAAKSFMLVLDPGIARPGAKIRISGAAMKQLQTIWADMLRIRSAPIREMIGQSNRTDTGSFFVKRRDEVIPTQRLNQKFHACFHARFALAISIEEAQNRSGQIKDLVGGKEFRIKLRQMRRTAQPTAEIDSKPALNFAIQFTGSGPEADVVNAQRGMIFGAAFEGNLELAPQVQVVPGSPPATETTFGIRPDVKGYAGSR